MTRTEIIAKLRSVGRFNTAVCDEAADMLEADGKPLTEREIATTCLGIFDTDGNKIYHRLNSTLITDKIVEVVRAVEAKHGIRSIKT